MNARAITRIARTGLSQRPVDGLLPLLPPDGVPVLDGQLGFQLPPPPLLFAIP